MNAKYDPRRLAAFVDGELSLDEQLAVEAQLHDDEAARAEVEAMRALHDSVKRQAHYHAAPASLRGFAAERVQGAQQQAPTRASALRSKASFFRSRIAAPWLAGASGMAAVLLCFSLFTARTTSDAALLSQEAVAGHVRASLSQHSVDVVSSERHTVKPYLSGRLDYSPPVPELHHPGLVFDGARVDYLDGRPVAVLVYRQGQHQVDAYVWPSASAHNAKPVWTQVNGFRVAGWTRQGMRWCMVSDVNETEFAALVGAFEQAGGAS